MRIKDLMTRRVRACGPDDTVNRAAQIMWEHGCGCVPVIDLGGHVLGMLTDRDVCMAAYTKGESLAQIPVTTAMSRHVYACRPEDTIEDAERLMWMKQVRRLPITDDAGRLLGLLSLSDIARHAARRASIDASPEGVARTLAGVSERPDAE